MKTVLVFIALLACVLAIGLAAVAVAEDTSPPALNQSLQNNEAVEFSVIGSTILSAYLHVGTPQVKLDNTTSAKTLFLDPVTETTTRTSAPMSYPLLA